MNSPDPRNPSKCRAEKAFRPANPEHTAGTNGHGIMPPSRAGRLRLGVENRGSNRHVRPEKSEPHRSRISGSHFFARLAGVHQNFHAAGRHTHITELHRNGATLAEARELARAHGRPADDEVHPHSASTTRPRHSQDCRCQRCPGGSNQREVGSGLAAERAVSPGQSVSTSDNGED